jgi:hypothetical protein
MRLRFLTSLVGATFSLNPGDESEFAEAEAIRLIEAGFAEPAKVEAAPIETATAPQPPIEKATAPKVKVVVPKAGK